ncbi:IS30 family transposase [Pelosinus baikalensis]|uniref:IS30 family transposase n=1 Tax=Pelosinus baikalensis TaxID=2892015 RepID=A0ABS8I141_9FIRM|nr:IS30 family transposase [Pelosinus baikalensis]MCC5468731.1 IS30 family transposase [Pelosinus baikalensis]
MSYHHLSTFDRAHIQLLNNLGYSTRKIGIELGRHHSSIARELVRNNTKGDYQAEDAHSQYHLRRTYSKPCGKCDKVIIDVITEKLYLTWSPEQIANTVLLGKLSFKTIYNWIYQGKLSVAEKVLRHKGKRHQPAEKRGKFAIGMSIVERPKEVKNRQVFGHWELDTMVSSRGKSKGCFATFVERKSRLYTAIKIPDRTANSMENAINYLWDVLPSGSFKSATTDRGKEFACHAAIKEKLGLDLYFADPYCSWQRGSNENSNGLLREFYPKKTDLSLVHKQDLMGKLFLINSRPKKCLDWKSPIDVFLHEVSHLN